VPPDGKEGNVALFIARAFHNTRISANLLMIFSAGHPLHLVDVAMHKKWQIISHGTIYVLFKCL
jgi:hypothetical protein